MKKKILLLTLLLIGTLIGYSQTFLLDSYKIETWEKKSVSGSNKNILVALKYQTGYLRVNTNTEFIKISLNGVDFSLEKVTGWSKEEDIMYLEFDGGLITITKDYYALDIGGKHFLAVYYREIKELIHP